LPVRRGALFLRNGIEMAKLRVIDTFMIE